MIFNKKECKQIKDFMLNNLNSVPFQYEGRDPVEWAKTFLPVIADCIEREHYEGAKGTSDAIREFLNQFIEKEEDKIKENDQLKIPAFKPIKIQGIVCFIDGTAQILN